MDRSEDMETMPSSGKRRLIEQVRRNLDGSREAEQVLDAMEVVDREMFVDDVRDAYLDTAIPIGQGQTISQPSTVADMLMIAEISAGHDVLEVGGGSGWNACLMAYLCYPGLCRTYEIVPELAEKARNSIDRLRQELPVAQARRLSNIELYTGDAFGDERRYDRIVVTAGMASPDTKDIENFAQKALKHEGMMVCPMRSGPLLVLRKERDGLRSWRTSRHYVFVPLKMSGGEI